MIAPTGFISVYHATAWERIDLPLTHILPFIQNFVMTIFRIYWPQYLILKELIKQKPKLKAIAYYLSLFNRRFHQTNLSHTNQTIPLVLHNVAMFLVMELTLIIYFSIHSPPSLIYF